MRNFKSVAFIASAAALLSACSSPVKLQEPKVEERAPVAQPTPPADTRDIRPVETGSVDPLNDPKGVLANRSVYFDFDSYVVREQAAQDPDPG
jgi:peptidoglycan-associated lipoprotein